MCSRVGANEFETLNDAYAAVDQAGSSVGVMMVSAGAKKTQKLKPLKVMSPPLKGCVFGISACSALRIIINICSQCIRNICSQRIENVCSQCIENVCSQCY